MKPKDFLFDWVWERFPQERLPPAAERLWRYLEFLQSEARKFNLTAIHDMGEMVSRHVADSLAPLGLPDCPLAGRAQEPLRVVDVGSGNGLPGLAVAIVFPAWQVTLLEANQKKCDFLRRAAQLVEAGNVEVANLRAEVAGRDPALRETFDLALARALAILPVAMELCLPLARPDGWMLTYKGEDVLHETQVSGPAFEALSARLEHCAPYGVGALASVHTALWIRKTAPTAPLYPRRDGMPKKRPLWAPRGAARGADNEESPGG